MNSITISRLEDTESIENIEKGWIRAQKLLLAMFDMEDNWDEEGAKAPKLDIIESAFSLLLYVKDNNIISPPTRILPVQDGGILIEWHLGDIYLEAEISDAQIIEWMLDTPGKPIQHWEWNVGPTVSVEYLAPRYNLDSEQISDQLYSNVA